MTTLDQVFDEVTRLAVQASTSHKAVTKLIRATTLMGASFKTHSHYHIVKTLAKLELINWPS